MTRARYLLIPILACALLVGCTPREPTPTAAPTVLLPPEIRGDEISASPLESDEWVIAARAADLGLTLALNTADFSIEQFTATRSQAVAENQYRDWLTTLVGDDQGPPVQPGPQVMLPLEVIASDDGSRATVRFCDAVLYWQEQDADTLTAGSVVAYRLVREDDRILFEVRGSENEVCDATGAAIGRFVPPMQPLGPISEADVRPPPGVD